MGIDISEKMLGKARERLVKSGKTNITLKQMATEKLDFENDSFYFVVTSCIICSFPDPAKELKEIRSVLKLFQISALVAKGAFSGGSSGI
jgi:ubiquinone/menaquinone biosynthesis C-methylase UbiE